MRKEDYYYHIFLLDEYPGKEIWPQIAGDEECFAFSDDKMEHETLTAFEYFLTMSATSIGEIRWCYPVLEVAVSFFSAMDLRIFDHLDHNHDWLKGDTVFEGIVTPIAAQRYKQLRKQGKLNYTAIYDWVRTEADDIATEVACEVQAFMEVLDEQFGKAITANLPALILSTERPMKFDTLWVRTDKQN